MFTSSGTIAIRAHQRDDHVIVSVSDTGIGIAAEYLTTIFEEFRQLEGTTNRCYEGTWPGSGDLPQAGPAARRRAAGREPARCRPRPSPSACRSGPQAPAQEGSATLATSSSAGLPVLVVDDDPTTIEIVAAYLEHEGYAVYGLTDSRRVLAEARALRPAAIILEVLDAA